ncbi:cleavage stimulation factor subunit 1-like [Hydractinia symbiolongicarpus]|uniref:cleavage stimulation factor subunit 1-like n=1 Tax=Hydractinia symbiolongicarpus TaxID=13093 RepID=UPI00254D8D5D|nr:cleavage stimulation factor subunit 1-like [Hydractinia symbiolongicarpus]
MAEAVEDQETMYKLIISQLRYDALDLIASSLAKCVGLEDLALAPSSRLLEVLKLGLQEEKAGKEPEQRKLPGLTPTIQPEATGLETNIKTGLDLEYEKEGYGTSPPVAQYETHYVTAHKGPVTSAAFTPDGRLCATGSVDTSIKIIDISRMLAKAAQSQAERQAERDADDGGGMKNHPVVRTMYDHDLAVNVIAFHPTTSVLVSGGEDRKVNLFDYTKSTVKKAYKCIGEVESVRDISIHPSGDFLLVATDHPTVRLYDLTTLQCYVSANPEDQHTASLTSVRYCPAANLYVTASKDGSWKLWDGVSNRCVQTYRNAHDGAEIHSVRFTKNSKFVLTSGRDSTAKLWELSTGRAINTYGGAVIHNNNHAPAIFNYTEDYVMFPDEKNMAIGCWDSRTAEKLSSLSSGHNNAIRHLVHSTCAPAFLSCSEDYRARFWYCRDS